MKNVIYVIGLAVAIPLVIASFAVSDAREAEARQLEQVANFSAVARAKEAAEVEEVKPVVTEEEKARHKAMQQEVVDSAKYWTDPGRHFMWSDLEFSPTAVQGVLTFTGRLKNVGERDARYVALKVSLRDAQKREVGRGNVQKHDGLKSGASWWFDGIMTVREPGGVEAFIAQGRAL